MKKVIIVIGLIFFALYIGMSSITEKVIAYESGTEVVVERNIFEEFYYRLVLKDTRDFYDYIMLATFITGMLIVLVFKNTHYYTVQVSKEIEKNETNRKEIKQKEVIYIEEKKSVEHKKHNPNKRKTTTKKKKVDSIETSSEN